MAPTHEGHPPTWHPGHHHTATSPHYHTNPTFIHTIPRPHTTTTHCHTTFAISPLPGTAILPCSAHHSQHCHTATLQPHNLYHNYTMVATLGWWVRTMVGCTVGLGWWVVVWWGCGPYPRRGAACHNGCTALPRTAAVGMSQHPSTPTPRPAPPWAWRWGLAGLHGADKIPSMEL